MVSSSPCRFWPWGDMPRGPGHQTVTKQTAREGTEGHPRPFQGILDSLRSDMKQFNLELFRVVSLIRNYPWVIRVPRLKIPWEQSRGGSIPPSGTNAASDPTPSLGGIGDAPRRRGRGPGRSGPDCALSQRSLGEGDPRGEPHGRRSRGDMDRQRRGSAGRIGRVLHGDPHRGDSRRPARDRAQVAARGALWHGPKGPYRPVRRVVQPRRELARQTIGPLASSPERIAAGGHAIYPSPC